MNRSRHFEVNRQREIHVLLRRARDEGVSQSRAADGIAAIKNAHLNEAARGKVVFAYDAERRSVPRRHRRNRGGSRRKEGTASRIRAVLSCEKRARVTFLDIHNLRTGGESKLFS